MTEVTKLKSLTVKDLAAMAKRKGVPGWHSMRKEELVKVLAKVAKEAARKSSLSANGRNGKANGLLSNGEIHNSHPLPSRKTRARALRRLKELQERLTQSKDLSHHCSSLEGNGYAKDRLVVMVRDSYWLHAYWELSRASVDRMRAALGQHWHGARPVLRICEVTSEGATSTTRRIVRDVEIHGGVNNWYVDVPDPPKSYQLDIGYLSTDRRFLSLARSNVVTTPPSRTANAVDSNWAEVAEDFDRIYAMSGGYSEQAEHSELRKLFEQRLRRPMGSPMVTRFGIGAGAAGRERREFCMEVDAELIVFGVTQPGAHVTLKGEPVRVESDGTFSMKVNLPDRRQVLPVVASSGDGMEQRTIVLAVERNTKIMEPVTREPDA